MKKRSESRPILNQQKIPLFIIILLLVFKLLLTSCNSTADKNNHSSAIEPDSIRSSEVQDTTLDPIVQLLLVASAKDFHEHQPPIPLGFRNVQFRYLLAPDPKNNRHLICGQFLVHDKQGNEEWIPFATIKTSPYEQWIGAQSLTFCQDSKLISYKIYDLSSALKSRVDSLINLK